MKYTKTTLKELTKRYSVVLRKCAFLNAAILMGTIAVVGSANAADATQQDLTGVTDLGTITAENTTITSGNSIYKAAKDSVVTIGANSVFKNNTGSIGSVISVATPGKNGVKAGQLIIKEGTLFEGNEAIWDGGAVGNYGDTTISGTATSNIIFRENKAYLTPDPTDTTPLGGGAISLGAESNTTIDYALFEGNETGHEGGAIAARVGQDNKLGQYTITNSEFKSNKALGYTDGGQQVAGNGGAIYNAFYKKASVSDTIFDGNTAKNNGGAIYNTGIKDKNDAYAVFTSARNTYKNNSAQNGGAIYNADGATLTIDGDTFISNSAQNGGAIYNAKGMVIGLTGTNTFENNTASVHGGAIYNAGELTVSSGSKFTGNTAHAGAAISGLSGSTTTIEDGVEFSGNYTSAQLGDAGGALYISDSTLTVGNNVKFDSNTALSTKNPATGAKGAAGAVYLYKTDATIGDNVTFNGNQAQYAGGAVYAWNPTGSLSIGENATFTNNKSVQGNGGALANFDGTTTIAANALFDGNSAVNGGAIVNQNFDNSTTSLTLTDATFTNNTATTEGGAIWNDGTMTFNGTTTFTGNTAGGVANDIHNTGSLTFNGDTTLSGGITGTGNVVFNGDNLDIGASVIQAKSVTIKDGSTLKADLMSGTAGFDAAALTGNDIKLVFDAGSENGTLSFAQNNAGNLTFANDNTLFDIVTDTDESKITITRKATDSLVDTLTTDTGMDETTALGVISMTEAQPTNVQAKAIADTIVQLAQSSETADQAKAGELTKATQPTRAPINQAINANTAVLRTVSARTASLRAGRSGGDLADAKLSPWVKGLFNKTHNSQGDGFDAYSRGFAFGVDAQITEDWLVGAGYARTATTVKEDLRRTHVNGDNYFVYGKYQPAKWYIESVLNYGHNKNKSEALGLTGKFDVDTYGAQLLSGYQYDIADNYAGLRYTYVKADNYNNGLNDVKSKNTQVATVVIGTRVAKEFKHDENTTFKPEFRLAGTYDIKSSNSKANVNVVGGNTTYSVDGHRLHRAALETGVGLTGTFGKVEVSADYDVEWRVSHFAQTGMLKLKYNF